MVEISIRNEIVRAAGIVGVMLTEVPQVEADEIRGILRQRYGRDKRFELNCNNVADYAAVQHPDSWRWIEEFASDEPVLFFYDNWQDQGMFRLDGRDVIRVLEECYGFEYYITNPAFDYLICHSDHDYIIGAGTAKPWVESLAPRHDEWAKTLTKGAEKSDDDR